MRHPQLMNVLISILTCGLLSLGTSVQAAVPENSANTITLEKTVQFEDAEGEEVLVAPGTYAVTAGKQTLSLTDNESNTSVTIEADDNSHHVDIPTPAAASIPGEDGPLANIHTVMLFLPDGHALQAIGTYPGIQSRGIPADTDLSGSTTTITFEKAVHFIAPDGSPVVADPGSYTAEVAQDWIRLIPGEERHNALLVEAQKGTNDTEVEELVALSLPGSTEKELDLHHVMLLLPTGQTLEATGSYSGIQPRGWFSRAFKNAKRTVGRTYKKARRTARKVGRNVGRTAKRVGKGIGKTAKKVGKGVGRTAKKVGKGIGKTAKKVGKGVGHAAKKVGKGVGHAAKKVGKGVSQAALKAKYAAEQAAKFAAAQAKKVAKFAKIAACKVTVALIKGGKAVTGVLKNLIPSIKSKKKRTQNRLKKDKNFRDQLMNTVTRNLNVHQAKIPELKRIAGFMNGSKKKLDVIFSASNFCSDSVSTMDKKLRKLGMVPKFAMVRSRGIAQHEHFYMGYQVSLGMAKGLGFQLGLMGVTDFRGNGGKYWFIGPQVITNVGGGVTAEVVFFPKVSLDSFTGWGSGVGISGGPWKVASAAIDVMLDSKVKKFQGFGIGGGAGIGALPVDAAFSYTHSAKF